MSEIDNIVLAPDPRLECACEPVGAIDAQTRALVKRMLKAMYEAEGCGLAAPQLGVCRQVVVIDVDYNGKRRRKNPYVLINPRILVADGDLRETTEGCLSFPGISVKVSRPDHVVVQALDIDGDLMQYEAQGNLLAVCLQHEIDHLSGKSMLDHLKPLARAQKEREYAEALAQGARPGEVE